MRRPSKRHQAIVQRIDKSKLYSPEEALVFVKETATAKFDESVDVAISLGIDVRKSDQVVRGSVVMPSGTGKIVRVAVFAQGEKAKEAEQAGADVVGFEDLADKIKAGEINFDLAIASLALVRLDQLVDSFRNFFLLTFRVA